MEPPPHSRRRNTSAPAAETTSEWVFDGIMSAEEELDDSSFLDSAEHAASAAAYRKERRESFRQRSDQSMRNPTPAMVRQARAMLERAGSLGGGGRRSPAGKAARRATPQ